MITAEEIEREKAYLKKVISILNDEIEKYDSKVKALSGNIQEQMNYAWDKTNRLSDTEFVYALANIQKRSVFAENANHKVLNYKKMLQSAYFARIDFKDSDGTEKVYIGISSLEHDDNFYVYDWRAPISSLFYSNDVGKASYYISTGEKVDGEITLKRQYKISGDEIKEIFDTDMQIIDDILISILSSNAGSKMKNIVNTIQKEQNEIIRKNDVDLLLVQGPAGSGKTSIAMHKLAYLLYSERDKINNSNLMILSPNEIFNNYISSVLPEIGEDNVNQTTFVSYAKNYINELAICSKVEDVYEIIYSNKKTQNSFKFNEIRFKYSNLYLKMLDKFIHDHREFLLSLEEIKIDDETILTTDDQRRFLNIFDNDNESEYIKGKRIIEKIFMFASTKTNKHMMLEKLKKQALDNLKNIKGRVLTLFKMLYSNKEEFLQLAKSVSQAESSNLEFEFDKIFDITKANLDAGKLEYQDVAPYMYFKSKIIGITANNHIKYVLIDEAQDYSIAQYKILSMLFKNTNITLLGDLNQCIMPFVDRDDYGDIMQALKEQKQNPTSFECELKKTYRSTFEINKFAKKVISQKSEYAEIERHGDEVKVTRLDVFDPEIILSRAIKLKKDFNTLAIICKNVEETLLYSQSDMFASHSDLFKIVTKNDNVFIEGKILIIPSYLSKGLEFDAVIVSNANSTFFGENDNRLLYVILTRALHKLEVFYSGELTPLLDNAKSDRG